MATKDPQEVIKLNAQRPEKKTFFICKNTNQQNQYQFNNSSASNSYCMLAA
jgi:hypothetical protein